MTGKYRGFRYATSLRYAGFVLLAPVLRDGATRSKGETHPIGGVSRVKGSQGGPTSGGLHRQDRFRPEGGRSSHAKDLRSMMDTRQSQLPARKSMSMVPGWMAVRPSFTEVRFRRASQRTTLHTVFLASHLVDACNSVVYSGCIEVCLSSRPGHSRRHPEATASNAEVQGRPRIDGTPFCRIEA